MEPAKLDPQMSTEELQKSLMNPGVVKDVNYSDAGIEVEVMDK